jgi:hypothetical protein
LSQRGQIDYVLHFYFFGNLERLFNNDCKNYKFSYLKNIFFSYDIGEIYQDIDRWKAEDYRYTDTCCYFNKLKSTVKC